MSFGAALFFVEQPGRDPRTPGVVQRIEGLRVQWLRSTEPLEWTGRRQEALIFADIADADDVAQRLTSSEAHVFPAVADRELRDSQEPQLFRDFPKAHAGHDWRERRDCGLD